MIRAESIRKTLVGAVLGAAVAWSSPSALAEVIDPGETMVFPIPDDARTAVDCDGIANDCGAGFDVLAGEASVFSVIVAGVLQSVSAETTLFSVFSVSPGDDRVLDARVSGSVSFLGELFAGGFLGAGAEVTITASLLDTTENSIAGSGVALNEACAGALLDACAKSVSGTRSVSFGAKVVRGHDYELRMTATCESQSGALGVDAVCAFAPTEGDLFGDGFVTWDSFSVAIDADLVGLINDLQASLDAHDTKLDQHDLAVKALLAILQNSVDETNAQILESIRLQLTPEGLRETDSVDCDGAGAGCNFPGGKN